MQWITRWFTNPGIARSIPASPVFRMRLETEVQSPYELVVVEPEFNPSHTVLKNKCLVSIVRNSFKAATGSTIVLCPPH